MKKLEYARQILDEIRSSALRDIGGGCIGSAKNVANGLFDNRCSSLRVLPRRYFCLDETSTIPGFSDKYMLVSKMFKGIGWRNHVVTTYLGYILDPLVGVPLKEPEYLDSMFVNDPSTITYGRYGLKELLAHSGISFSF